MTRMSTRGHYGNTSLQGGGPLGLTLDFLSSLQPVIFLPNAFSTDFDIPSPTASPPPSYDNVGYVPKESSE